MSNGAMRTKTVTGKVRLSYVHLLEPDAMEVGQEPKYSVSIIIPKSDTKTLKRIDECIKAAIEEGKSKWGGKVPSNLQTPLRDGDVDREDDPAYANSYFVNAKSKYKPQVVDANLNPIMDSTEIYSGMYARVSINFFGYNAAGNKGVAAGLNNVQKIADGDFLGGRAKAEDEFEVWTDDESTKPSYLR